MNNLIIIDGINIRQDKEGRYSLNDLHKAAGGNRKYEPNAFLRLDSTKELIEEIKYADSRIWDPVKSKKGSNGGSHGCKEIVYAYAMWISAAFNLKVIRTFDAVMTGKMEWKQARLLGKTTRRELTDTIQQFISYAKKQGSQNADKYYMAITKMEYQALELVKSESDQQFRDTFNVLQHHQLAVIEHAAKQALLEGMFEEIYYKDCFKKAKQACLMVAAPLLKYTQPQLYLRGAQ